MTERDQRVEALADRQLKQIRAAANYAELEIVIASIIASSLDHLRASLDADNVHGSARAGMLADGARLIPPVIRDHCQWIWTHVTADDGGPVQ